MFREHGGRWMAPGGGFAKVSELDARRERLESLISTHLEVVRQELVAASFDEVVCINNVRSLAKELGLLEITLHVVELQLELYAFPTSLPVD